MRGIFAVFATWLGLAGIADSTVEWQSWFEQGIMQHWRSIKIWIEAVFLDWLPFDLPNWTFDYLILGAITARTAIEPAISKGHVGSTLKSRASPWHEDRHAGHVFRSMKYELSGQLRSVVLIFIIIFSWPIVLFGILSFLFTPSSDREYYLKGHRAAGKSINEGHAYLRRRVSKGEIDRRRLGLFKRLLGSILSFIPIIFVLSNLLYQHG